MENEQKSRPQLVTELHSLRQQLTCYGSLTVRNEMQEKPLLKSKRTLRTLINASPDIICFKDGQGCWLEANNADLDLFSLTGVDYQGKTDSQLAEFTHPIYKQAFLACQASDEMAWQEKGISRGEEIISTPDGTTKIYDVTKVPLFEKDGTRKGLVVLGRDITGRIRAEEALQKAHDELELQVEKRTAELVKSNMALRVEITERMRAEEAARESEERFRALSEASFEAIVFSEHGVFLDQNQAMERMFGYTKTEAIGMYGTEFIVPEDRQRVKEYILQVMKNHTKQPGCERMGRYFHVKSRPGC